MSATRRSESPGGTPAARAPEIRLRTPTVEDGRGMYRIVRESGVLDENSPYAYLLLSTHFAPSSVVAEAEGRIVGFVAGYRPPSRPDAAFVWQVAVDPAARRRGLGKRMLRFFLDTPGNRTARYLEATVTPSNGPSRRLFESLARSLGVPSRWSDWFTGSHFGSAGHEAEELIRIGPLEKRDGDV
jgi:L-2,4-diaminobutyric acid acetyltransferase